MTETIDRIMRYRDLIEARSYPLADPDTEWHGNLNYRAQGGRMVWMTPTDYLKQVRPLDVDETSYRPPKAGRA